MKYEMIFETPEGKVILKYNELNAGEYFLKNMPPVLLQYMDGMTMKIERKMELE